MKLTSLKYILDILSVIDELEKVIQKVDRDFFKFKADFMAVRTVEREFEIIGEALNKLTKENPSLVINDSRKIISLRNLIIHSYDSVENEILWESSLKIFQF